MNNIQEKVKQFIAENKMDMSPQSWALDLSSETGEVSKEILKMTDYGRGEFVVNKEINSELGDVLYSLIGLANSLNVDLEESLNMVLEKYKNRKIND